MNKLCLISVALFVSCFALSCGVSEDEGRLSKLKESFIRAYPNGFEPEDGWYHIKFARNTSGINAFSTSPNSETGIGAAKLCFEKDGSKRIGDYPYFPTTKVRLEQLDFKSIGGYVSPESYGDNYVVRSVHTVYDGDRFYYGMQTRKDMAVDTLEETSCGGSNVKMTSTDLLMCFYPLYHPDEWSTNSSGVIRYGADLTATVLTASFYSRSNECSWRCDYLFSQEYGRLKRIHFSYVFPFANRSFEINISPIEPQTINVPIEYEEDVSGKTVYLLSLGQEGLDEIVVQ